MNTWTGLDDQPGPHNINYPLWACRAAEAAQFNLAGQSSQTLRGSAAVLTAATEPGRNMEWDQLAVHKPLNSPAWAIRASTVFCQAAAIPMSKLVQFHQILQLRTPACT